MELVLVVTEESVAASDVDSTAVVAPVVALATLRLSTFVAK